MNTIATDNDLFGQFFDLIKLKNQGTKNIPLSENGKKLLNEVYANRFFWRINLFGLQQRLIVLNKKGKDVNEIIKNEYHLN